MVKNYSRKKIEGATFTPKCLAEFLATRLASYVTPNNSDVLNVNDPACGDGVLLEAISACLESHQIAFNISGTDKDLDCVNNTRRNLLKLLPIDQINVAQKDFIADKIGGLFNPIGCNDIVIANPPYVRTQILGTAYAQTIAKLYNLSGRIDLYYPFLINMTESLKEGGILGVITSNRYISTKSGASIRKFLYENYDILEIFDLGDTKLFDAAVLPAIFIGRKKSQHQQTEAAKYVSVYESNAKENAIEKSCIFDFINDEKSGIYRIGEKYYKLSVGQLKLGHKPSDVWRQATAENNSIVETIERNSTHMISDFFKVRVGIKSCADEVFFTQQFDGEEPEDVWFREMISQEDITKWYISPDLRKVIYPHFDNNGKKEVRELNNYPKARAFFIQHEDRLKKRNYLIKAKRNWYEYWVPQNPVLWKQPKIVWADISSSPRFALDKSGAIVNGNCYWITANNSYEEELLYMIMGVANSHLIELYHDLKFNNKLYSGKRRYLSQYVECYPLPDLNCEASKRIISIVKDIVKVGKNNPNLENSLIELEKTIRLAYGFRD